MCLGCFQRQFPADTHEHPRESFAVERVRMCTSDVEDRFVDESEIDLSLTKTCVFCKNPFSDYEFMNPIARTKKRKTQSDYFFCHYICAEYSPEVYSLNLKHRWFNINAALERSKSLKCFKCKRLGATLGCFDIKCEKSFHIPCSGYSTEMLESGAIFWCPSHNEVINNPSKCIF